MSEIIRIKTFGGFSVSYGGKTITDQDNRSKKLWLILEYIIAFHDRSIPQSTIIDLIWSEDSISSDPENALKTSLHRIRGLIDDLEIPEKKIIIRKQGTFSWNSKLDCTFDFEDFITLCNKVNDSQLSDEERVELFREAFDIYKGDFLPKCVNEGWAAALSTRYHSIYVKMVCAYMELLERLGSYDEMVNCLSVANVIDSVDEKLNYYYIFSLYKTGNRTRAIEQYEKVVAFYYDEFGVEPPESLFNLYSEITAHEDGVESDLNSIQADLIEKNTLKAAYLCDYSVFQHFYRVQARTCARNGMSIFLCLVTVKQHSKEASNQKLIARGMEKMERVIADSLRSSDIFARYSKNQYIAMLPTACYENSIMVGERILKNFDKTKPSLNLNVSYSVRYLEPKLFE